MSKKQKQDQDGYSKTSVVDFHELTNNAKENQLKTDLIRAEEKVVALSMTIDQMLKKLADKEEEILHLKAMLMGQTPVIGEVSPLIVSDEEYIALQQIQKLKENARVRELTLDEVKKLDLLIKNKRLAQGNATTIEVKKIPENTPKTKLIEIAKKSINIKED